MARGDIENIDALFSDALDAGADSLDAFGNPEAAASDLFDDEDSFVVLDESDAMGMFDTLDVVDIDDDEDDEEDAGAVDLAAGPVVESRRSPKSKPLTPEPEDDDDEDDISEIVAMAEKRAQAKKTGAARPETARPEPARPEPARPKTQKANDDADDDVEVPDWVVSLRSKLLSSVAHAFLLSGNVRDYMVRNITIKDGLVKVLDPDLDKFEVIAEYDQAHGLSFYGDDVDAGGGRSMADIYRERFMDQMHEAQDHLSMPRTDDIPNRDPVSLFTCMSYMFDHPSKTSAARILLFIDYSDFLVPDASAAQMKPEERKLAITLSDIGRSARADDAGNCLIFMTDDVTQLSTRIRSAESRIEHMKIPIPDLDERLDFIEHVLDVDENTLSDGTQVFDHPDSIDKNTFAINTAGLSRIQIEDIVLRCLCDDEPLSLRIMKDRKNDIIHEDYDDVLEIIDPKFGFDRIGGLEHLKNFFREEIIEPIHAGELEAVPMGVLLCGPPGTSKHVVSTSKIPVPGGVTTVGQLVPGDKVFGLDGQIYTVQYIELKGEHEIYELELTDGRIVQASGDHPFLVMQKAHGKWRPRIYSMEEMLEKGVHEICPADRRGDSNRTHRARFHMPQAAAIQHPERELPLDPYLMGAFLGDGCKNDGGSFRLSSGDRSVPQLVADLLGAVTFSKTKGTYTWDFYNSATPRKGVQSRIKIKDVAPEYERLLSQTYCHNKYIPAEYKYGSIEQRLALIQGLMDTDGCIRNTLEYEKDRSTRFGMGFATTSERLRDDFIEVVYSLGYSCSWSTTIRAGKPIPAEYRKPWGPYVYKHDLYEIRINVANEEKINFFRMKRKKDIAKLAGKYHKRRDYSRIPIADIRATGRFADMRCISVDAPDHVFLIGDCVPTHNTFLSKAVAHEAEMNFVALNLNRIMEKWVGSTERNLDRALDCAMAMAPTIIFIDEIDEALPNRADPNQTAVNKRINQRLLTFFADTLHRGQVMILAATNYPEKVDPAFKRAGRFDMRLPMFAPDEFDRMRIMLVIAKSRGYTFSWFDDPDTLVPNPFANLRAWLEAGNTPINEKFVGDRASWRYTTTSSIGSQIQHEVFLPKKLIAIIDAPNITLQQFYEGARILFEDMPQRAPDPSTGEIETDEVFFGKIHNYLLNRTDVIGTHGANVEALFERLKKWEMIYKPFCAQTFQMTGAELDVVMNKAITLWRRFVRQKPEALPVLIQNGIIQDDHDIPWEPFLFNACRKTVNAVAGIKLMEDNALLNTSDLDFIPDAMYAETDDGRQISYHERQEELVAGQTKAQLNKK